MGVVRLLPLVVALLLVADGAAAQSARVLPPTVGPVLLEVFRAQPEVVTLKGASIAKDSVDVDFCLPDGSCEQAKLTDAQGDCAGTRAGAFCLSEGVSPAGTQALSEVLRDVPDSVWLMPASQAPVDESPGAVSAPGETEHAPIVAWALVLVPLAFGALVGVLLRRRRAAVLMAAAAVLVVGIVIVLRWQQLAAWDGLSCVGWATVGVVVGGLLAANVRGWLLAGLVLGVSTLALEMALRQLPPAPTIAYPETPSLLVNLASYDVACQALFPSQTPEIFEQRIEMASDRSRRVLHVGDSMAAGRLGLKHVSFVMVLDKRDGQRAHVNAAIRGTSTDYQYLLARQWMQHGQFEAVVAHLYPANDLVELDRPSMCCAGQSLLVDQEGQPSPRCETAEARWGLVERLAYGAPPYPLRLARHHSALGARLVHAVHVASGALVGGGPEHDQASMLARERQLVTVLRDEVQRRGGKLSLVVHPYRASIVSEAPDRRETHERFVAAVSGLGVEVHDAWPVVEEAARSNLPGLWDDLEGPRDGHYGDAGHLLIAGWLQRLLQP